MLGPVYLVVNALAKALYWICTDNSVCIKSVASLIGSM